MFLVTLILSLGLASCAKDGGKKEIKLAYVNWAEGIAMTNLAAVILEDKLGYKVDLTMADAAPVFTSLSNGNSDVFLDVWLPVTHKDYLERFSDKIVDLGIVYENALLGLVVPSYVNINSIEELNANKELFGKEIIGIDAGAGLMGAAERAVEAYELDFTLRTGSGPVMTAALGKAIAENKPIVVTGWAPHWKFAKWDLKVLEDPKGEFGATENIHKYSRTGFEADMPEAAAFIKAFKLSEAELGNLMDAIENGSGEPKDLARTWMNENKALVDSWLD